MENVEKVPSFRKEFKHDNTKNDEMRMQFRR